MEDEKCFISITEVKPATYQKVMGKNPSLKDGTIGLRVNNVNWYDAVIFCNKLSEKLGLTPVYSVNGIKDTNKWRYNESNPESFKKKVEIDYSAIGIRLPTESEIINAYNNDKLRVGTMYGYKEYFYEWTSDGTSGFRIMVGGRHFKDSWESNPFRRNEDISFRIVCTAK